MEAKDSMVICIDYDGTYTRDPETWDMALLIFQQHGHRVYCVSARHQDELVEARTTIGYIIPPCNIVGTNGAAKRDYLFKEHGVYGDVWIDDNPDTVSTGYALGEGWVTQFDGSKPAGPHATHCCITHGCKYGDEDCPVVNGKVAQVYPCEDCPDTMSTGVHPSHKTRGSDASSFDEICVFCGRTDTVPGGWGKLSEPCPATLQERRERKFDH